MKGTDILKLAKGRTELLRQKRLLCARGCIFKSFKSKFWVNRSWDVKWDGCSWPCFIKDSATCPMLQSGKEIGRSQMATVPQPAFSWTLFLKRYVVDSTTDNVTSCPKFICTKAICVVLCLLELRIAQENVFGKQNAGFFLILLLS